MANILKLPDLWRVLREVDLQAIRRDAESRFRLLVLADALADAAATAALLAGEPGHPWIETAAVPDPVAAPATVTLALLVTRAPDLSPGLAAAAETLRSASVPIVTVVPGGQRRTDAIARPGETARVVVAALDHPAAPAVAEALARAIPPRMRLALARQLPPVRNAVFSALIEETAKANATYAFTAGLAEAVPVLDVPLNLADTIVLTKNQLIMGYKIAVASGQRGRPRDVIGEMVGVIGGGFLFRQAARSLIGLIPVAGIVPKVVVAYTGTWAIGRAVAVWATQGRKVSRSTLARFSREARERGRAVARSLTSRKSRAKPLTPPLPPG